MHIIFDLKKMKINLILMKIKVKKSDNKKNKYKFDNDENIIKSFENVFKENNIEYNIYDISKYYRIDYLFKKLEDRIPRDLYNYFKNKLEDQKKLTYQIPKNENKIISNQDGYSLFNKNKIKINTNLLNKNIMSIRYLTGRKLTNKLLKNDYKISKNMVNAIKFNKDIHKLSKNEKDVYYELQKYLNKDQNINVLNGSYLAGDNSKNLFNKINKILYNKFKNNLITQKEYTNLLSKINKV